MKVIHYLPYRRYVTNPVLFTIISALVYNSWPLGYYLNPLVVHHGGLASELEGLRQPYNWLFMLMDVIAGFTVIFASVSLWAKNLVTIQKLMILNFASFGILTIIDAVLPMSCEPSIMVCPGLMHQPLLIIHGVASIGSAICLFASAALMWLRVRHSYKVPIMSVIMFGWTISGLLTLYFFFHSGPGNLSQDYYLILCGIWIAIFPIMLQQEPFNSTSGVSY